MRAQRSIESVMIRLTAGGKCRFLTCSMMVDPLRLKFHCKIWEKWIPWTETMWSKPGALSEQQTNHEPPCPVNFTVNVWISFSKRGRHVGLRRSRRLSAASLINEKKKKESFFLVSFKRGPPDWAKTDPPHSDCTAPWTTASNETETEGRDNKVFSRAAETYRKPSPTINPVTHTQKHKEAVKDQHIS